MNNKKIIAFLGTDGSGKTTMIKKLEKYLKNNKISTKYIHLRPTIFNKNKKVVLNPHDQDSRSKFLSFIKLFYWLFIFKFYFIFKSSNNFKVFFFDRYPHDLLYDPIRYRFNLNKKITKKILELFPTPDLWIIMSGNPLKIWNRKREIKYNVLEILLRRYVRFGVSTPNTIIFNKNSDFKKIINFIKNKILL
jgi:thymidylate kinase